ncbi:MAG: glycosyltransferase family A protein [Actinomycetes bacterium]
MRIIRALVTAGSIASATLTAQIALNLALIKKPCTPNSPITERVSILLPVRNEVHRVEPTLRSMINQQGLADLEIIVLDDGSTDGTADAVRRVAAGDPRVRLIQDQGGELPPGWLGKPWACQRLGKLATGSVLVFVDADVTLSPHAVASGVSLLRESQMQLVSPYPKQAAHSIAERITQPLVNWSWIATLPLRLAERSSHPAWSAAIGQFLIIDTDAYRASGGHEPVAEVILEDVGVLRNLKRNGYRGIPVDGSDMAECRMYTGAQEIYEGYTKSLWSAFGRAPGSLGGIAAMLLIYVLPAAATLTSKDATTRRWGAFGYASGVAGRAMVARRTGERVWPDSLSHPASLATFAGLATASVVRKRRGTITWKGRGLEHHKVQRSNFQPEGPPKI